MYSIQFFQAEGGVNILCTVNTANGVGYVEYGEGYKEFVPARNPFVLRTQGLSQFDIKSIGNTRPLNFVIPITLLDGIFHAMEFNDYYDKRSFGSKVSYVKIHNNDRLKLSLSARKNRNLKFDIYDYKSLELYSKRDLYLMPCSEAARQKFLAKLLSVK